MIDDQSLTWATVRDHCKAALAASRAVLESPGTSADATALHRGRIQALKGVLALVTPTTPAAAAPKRPKELSGY